MNEDLMIARRTIATYAAQLTEAKRLIKQALHEHLEFGAVTNITINKLEEFVGTKNEEDLR